MVLSQNTTKDGEGCTALNATNEYDRHGNSLRSVVLSGVLSDTMARFTGILRYGDWGAKARELTEETDRNGATYFEKVQELRRDHEKKKQDILQRTVQIELSKTTQPLELAGN